MSGRVTRMGDYFHVAVETESGLTEHWLLTHSEIARIRERGAKHALARPRPTWAQRVGYRLRKLLGT